MKISKMKLLTAFLLPLIVISCIERPTGPIPEKTVHISGKVLRSDNQTPIVGAVVTLKQPPLSVAADNDGLYEFVFETDSSYTTQMITLKSGFAPDTTTLSIVPGKDISQNLSLKVAIITGLPDQGHFTMTIDRRNFPGLVGLDARNTVRVRAGDKFGNPVTPGTKIDFSSRGGTIEGSALTDNSGFAQATLYGGNPQPVDPVFGRGFTWVRASTPGEGGSTVKDSVLVLFSGTTQVTGPVSGFTLGDGAVQSFEYSIADENGNPLTAGTSISVSVAGSGDVKLEGDTRVTLSDTQDRNRFTRFSFTITDTKPLDSAGDQDLSITISVSSSNGNKTYLFTGKLLAAAISGGGRSGAAATIALVQLTRNAISVKEVGGEETSIVTFEVRDSVGRPVDGANQVVVSFTLTFQGNAGAGGEREYVSPSSVSTDPQTGRIQTTVNSGTRAGVVQLVAQTQVGSRAIRSAPVIINIYGGFPDFTHFTVFPERLNISGLDIANLRDRISVLAGDKYSNPVRPSTAVYFSTTGGVINVPSTAYTNDDGLAVATLISGNPRPIDPILGPGFARVSATTVGERGETVSDTVVVLFSGAPQITNVSPTAFAVPRAGSSGPINFTVSDRNGNPVTGGTTIKVVLQYEPPPNTTINLRATGDVDITLGDTQARGSGTTQFSFQVQDQTVGGIPATIPVTVVITVTTPLFSPVRYTLNGTAG